MTLPGRPPGCRVRVAAEQHGRGAERAAEVLPTVSRRASRCGPRSRHAAAAGPPLRRPIAWRSASSGTGRAQGCWTRRRWARAHRQSTGGPRGHACRGRLNPRDRPRPSRQDGCTGPTSQRTGGAALGKMGPWPWLNHRPGGRHSRSATRTTLKWPAPEILRSPREHQSSYPWRPQAQCGQPSPASAS